MRKNNSLLSVQ